MTLVLKGNISSGIGAANQTLRFQKPHLIQYFPEIREVKEGTINVHLDEPLHIRTPSYTTPPIEWVPGQIERFGFLRIKFEFPLGAEPQPAWIYIPDNSPHRYNLFGVEIIAPPIQGLRSGESCQIHIQSDHKVAQITIVV